MAGVMGIGQNYLFPAFQKGAHSYQEGRGCPGCNYYPIGVDAPNSVSLLIIVADSLAQSGGSEAMRIVGIAPGKGFYRRVLYGLRSIEIRLANLKVNHGFSGSLHFLGAFQNIHDNE
jgi:hypothetical protein